MNRKIFRQYFKAVVIIVLISVPGLWAWNTLSEIFHWPIAQYKHVMAALVLLFILRWMLHRCHHVEKWDVSAYNNSAREN